MTDVRRVHLPELSEQQQKFFDSAAKEQLGGGAKRGGKTVVGCVKSIALSAMIPGNRGLIGRLHWPELRDSTLETFKRVCPAELIQDWRAQDKIHIIRTKDPLYPSVILWRALGDPTDFEKAKGVDLGWMWLDEPTEVPEETYHMLRAQLCWTLPNGNRPPYMTLLTSNPEPGWVKRRFIEKMIPGGVFIPFLPRDNPHLPPGWETELRETMHGDWVGKYLDGSWNIGEGSPFKELNAEYHVLEDIDWVGMKLIGCIDPASTGVTAYLQCGIDSDENLYALEEYYQKDRLISQHAAAVLSMMTRYGVQDYTLIDPSTEAKTLQGSYELYSVQEEYRRHGVMTMAARRANIEVGINLICELLHLSPKHRHPRTQQPGAPRLFIQKSKCPNLWREMEDLRTEILPSGKIDYIGADHAVDNLRMIAMSRPIAPEGKVELPFDQTDPLGRKAWESFQRFDKNFGKSPSESEWFPRPN